ncbi:Aquaporin-2 [Colletotrichum sp. SAR11_239]|nr:Aquaporin-2 [Colletotrichum sp. SAR11_239]
MPRLLSTMKNPKRVIQKLASDGDHDNTLPMLSIADTTRNKIVSGLGEFCGTFLFLFFSFAGTQVANVVAAASASEDTLTVILFVALSFGVSLTANVWAFYRVSGGLFNPVLVFVILMLAVEKHRSTFLAPVGIGVSFFLSELVGVYFTGASLNPARSFGPAVVNRQFPGYFWIYVFGPTFGSLLACLLYAVLRWLRYYEVNPDQDADGQDEDAEAAAKD